MAEGARVKLDWVSATGANCRAPEPKDLALLCGVQPVIGEATCCGDQVDSSTFCLPV